MPERVTKDEKNERQEAKIEARSSDEASKFDDSFVSKKVRKVREERRRDLRNSRF